MKLITWNIQWARGVDNKVDPRRIIDHAREMADFDVLCLQETKPSDHNFPRAEIEAAGYQVAFSGQKTYNGVALLARNND